MTLRLYNTLTRTKEDFVPLDPKNVRMYVCGPTVYDFAHIGNARPVIVFDVLFRLLRHLYGADHVTYVRNITDIDDKINARALERLGGRDVPILDVVRELTTETGRVFNEDVAALGNLPPTHAPRATEFVGAMIAMIEKLIAAGHSYEAQGHVLFDVSSKPDYGKLARRSLDEMLAGARVDVAPYKRGPMDFVLWKPSDANTPGWESPWGRGRPGWHIECSAMSEVFLGESFDIHGGGIDLVFPHHENEIAQSESAHHGHPLARVWMHNGFLNVEGEKMSKSLGNFVTIRELLDEVPGAVLRLLMLESHYRQPLNWTRLGMDRARREMLTWNDFVADHWAVDAGELDESNRDSTFFSALEDDLNTPLAITRLREMFASGKNDREAALSLHRHAKFLGLQPLTKPGFFESAVATYIPDAAAQKFNDAFLDIRGFRAASANNFPTVAQRHYDAITAKGLGVSLDENGRVQVTFGQIDADAEIEKLIAARNAARKAKNFAEADRIRDALLEKGIVLKDGPTGTNWEVKR